MPAIQPVSTAPQERDPVVMRDQAVVWHTVTDIDTGGYTDSFMVCPTCWPLHARRSDQTTKVTRNPPYQYGDRCQWCSVRRPER